MIHSAIAAPMVRPQDRTALLIAFTAMGAFLLGRALELQWLCMLTKPIPILMLIQMVRNEARDRYASLLVAGLSIGLVGDLLLELSPKRFFVPGLAAFLLGHVCYIAAYLQDGRRLRLATALPFFAYGAVLFMLIRPQLGAMLVPVAAYAATIAVMGWRAAARVTASPSLRPDQWAAVAGSIIFMFSDSLIALNRFYTPIPYVGYAIILTYWMGQLGIAYSVCRRR